MIHIEGLTKSYYQEKSGREVSVYRNFDLELPSGRIVSFLGGNGCGKTTLFFLIAGLTPLNGGRITVDGLSVSRLPIGFVFQDYKRSLFPWKTVLDNICLPLEEAGERKKAARVRVREFIRSMGFSFLEDFLTMYPYELSGGMAQAAALVRAVVHGPRLLLLDEPLGALDLNFRLFMEDKILELQRRTGLSVLLISHDIEEAVYLGDICVVLGRKPVAVKAIREIDIPAPRCQDTKHTSRFVAMKKEVFDAFADSGSSLFLGSEKAGEYAAGLV